MAIEIRTATDADWPDLAHVDGRNFGISYTAEMLEQDRPHLDMSRFRIALDGAEIVGVAGSFAMDVTLPGGSTAPMGGVTWVSVSATHRRQGVLTRLMEACHRDIDDRGEPLATLGASEAAIYERFGYGAATVRRSATISPRGLTFRPEFHVEPGSVRFMTHDDAAVAIPALWDRFRRTRTGEVSRDQIWHDLILATWAKPLGEQSEVFFLRHADGYAAYRVKSEWNEGFPHHVLTISELAAVTPEAHVALWSTLLGIDLIGTIVTRQMPIDDPLPYLLDDPRAVRTTELTDGRWVNVRDVRTAFGARTYATDDRLVVELSDGQLAGRRYAIEGGACTLVRSRPDLVASHAALGALLYGGVWPSTLAAGRRLTARNDDALRRADLFFPTSRAPHCQTMY